MECIHVDQLYYGRKTSLPWQRHAWVRLPSSCQRVQKRLENSSNVCLLAKKFTPAHLKCVRELLTTPPPPQLSVSSVISPKPGEQCSRMRGPPLFRGFSIPCLLNLYPYSPKKAMSRDLLAFFIL